MAKFKFYVEKDGTRQDIVLDQHLTMGEIKEILKRDFKGYALKCEVLYK